MSEEREYIVILKQSQDLDNFYDDMESRYGSDSVPDRIVECAYRRPMSRSTHYWLTDEEAAQVATDPRVETIERHYSDIGLQVRPMLVQNSNN